MIGVDDYIKNQQETMPIGGTPAEGAPAEGTPAEGTPAEGTPAEGTPAEGTPAEGTPAEGTPAEGTPAEGTPAEGTPAEGTPAEGAPAEGTPVEGLNEAELNTFFDTEGKTKEDIKALFSLGDKYSELEGQNSEAQQALETLRDQHTKLKEELNPLSYFSSEEAYVAEQLRKKYPTMDAVAIQKSVMTDLKTMGDLDVLALQDVIKRPGVAGGEAMAKKIIAADLGIDLDDNPDDWDDVTKGRVSRAAYDAREELGKFQHEVELPTTKSEEDLLTESAQRDAEIKKEWEPVLPELVKFDKISIPGPEGSQPFEFEVPQSFKDELGEFFEEMITTGELEANDDTVGFLLLERNKEFIYQNLGKIREAIEADVSAKIKNATDKELGNETPPNNNAAPAGGEIVGGTETWLGKQRGGI